MICKECGEEMYLFDHDLIVKDIFDNYWCCLNDNCLTFCFEQFHYGQSFKQLWHSENNNQVNDYVIKYNI